MSSSTIVSIVQSGANFTCQPYSSDCNVWQQPSTDGQLGMGGYTGSPGVYRRDTMGNDCYMEYSFNATGVSVNILGNYNHGVYSCQLDDGSPQWFNSNSASPAYKIGCTITGLSNDQHTLKITNGPLSGWALTVQNITLMTGNAFTDPKTVRSSWPSYQLPQNLESNCTSTVSSGGHVSTAAFASVAAVLAALFIGATIAAVYFWVRDSRFRRDHQWTEAISAAPIAYTTEPATSANISGYRSLTPPPQPPSMADRYPPSYQVAAASSTSKAQ